jgi:PAS domain S-box-containing protein
MGEKPHRRSGRVTLTVLLITFILPFAIVVYPLVFSSASPWQTLQGQSSFALWQQTANQWGTSFQTWIQTFLNNPYLVQGFVPLVLGGFIYTTMVVAHNRVSHSERQLRQAEEKYRSIFENAVTGIFQSTPDGRYLSANPAMARILGYADPQDLIEQLTDIKHSLYVYPEQREEFVAQMTRDGFVSEFEAQVYRQDGSIIWIATSAVVIHGEEGQLLCYEGTVENITTRKQTEAALREREERFRSLLSNISGAVYRCAHDDGWTMEFISEPIQEITGYAATDFINNHTLAFAETVALEDSDRIRDEIDRALAEKRPYILEYRIHHADGSIRWVYEKGQGIFDESDTLIWLDGVIFDITDRKRTEERLRLLESVVVNTSDAVVITEVKGVTLADLEIVYVNQAFTHLTGYSLDEVLGRSPILLKGTKTNRGELNRIHAALKHQESLQTELVAYRKDGSEFWLALEMVPILNEQGTCTHWISVQRDMSDRKQTEETLRKNKEAAEEANRAKSQFLANMSHELRTPLNAIIGYSEMLQEDAEDLGYADLVPDLEKIRGAGKHLLALINDILDISKIEAGKMELYLETFDVAQVIFEVESTIQPLMEKNHNTLQIHCPSDIGSMHADLTKLRQSLFNLLSNSAKFTENGTITLTVDRGSGVGDRRLGVGDWEQEITAQSEKPEVIQQTASNATSSPPEPRSLTPAPPSWITFRVTDTGIGMSLEQMSKVFHAFTQADASTTRKYGGTGLGLAITRHFCQMMGGDISVHSEINQGSSFTICLPIEVTPLKEKAYEPSHTNGLKYRNNGQSNNGQSNNGLKPSSESFGVQKSASTELATVLVIDDDATVRDLMARYLAREGFHVETAATGDKGLKRAKELLPDAITLDVLLPNMNGWEVLSALKADPELADIPVVVMSIIDDKNTGFRLGATDYLTKPVDYKRLTRLLHQYQPVADPGSIGQVLVVEDDPTTREMFRRMLEKEGWQVAEAENGKYALEKVAIHPPNLILLDLMMPEMDGFEFLNILRQHPDWRSLPIIVVTAMELTPADRLQLNGYVEQILQKGSFNRDDLLREVRDLVLSWVKPYPAASIASQAQHISSDHKLRS